MKLRIAYIGILVLVITLFAISVGYADVVGITKARLIQFNDTSYVFEADVTNPLVWANKAPIFPDRFQVSEIEYINQSGWIIVKIEANTSGKPLSVEDEILLPWARSGADITVQWSDGNIQQGLFLHTIEGIKVPLRLLIHYEKSLTEICIEHFLIRLKHIPFGLIHILIVVVIVQLVSSGLVFRFLLFVTFGQVFSLLFADLGIPGLSLLFVEILGVLLILIFVYSTTKKKEFDSLFPLLFIYGLLH